MGAVAHACSSPVHVVTKAFISKLVQYVMFIATNSTNII